MAISCRCPGLAREPGFTLLELVIVLAATVILLLIAAPSLQTWQYKQRMKAAVHQLRQDLTTARSQAVLLRNRVVVCPGLPASGCENESDWSNGWLVFQDINDDKNYNPTEPLIRVSGAVEQLSITSAASRPQFVFQPSGSAPGSNGSLWFCDARGPEKGHRIVISNLGRIRQEPYSGLGPEQCPPA